MTPKPHPAAWRKSISFCAAAVRASPAPQREAPSIAHGLSFLRGPIPVFFKIRTTRRLLIPDGLLANSRQLFADLGGDHAIGAHGCAGYQHSLVLGGDAPMRAASRPADERAGRKNLFGCLGRDKEDRLPSFAT